MYGAGPFSKVRYGRTEGTRRERKKDNQDTPVVPRRSEAKLSNERKESDDDSDATIYLILGASLGCVCIVLFSACMVLTVWRRHKTAHKFSSTNADIHQKYQDTSLQISSRLQHGHSFYQDKTDASTESQAAIHETSFTVTDHSADAGIDQYSQGSTVFVQVSTVQYSTARADILNSYFQDSIRNLNVTIPTPDGESLADEYIDEPSRISWKRRRKSEEIL